MYCNKCGTQVEEGTKFCANCGALVVDNSEQKTDNGVVYTANPVNNYGQELPGKGMGIAAMVLGIVSLALFCIWYISIPCAITGIALGVVSYKKAQEIGAKNTMATSGVICGAIAAGLALLFIIIVVILASIGAASSMII